MDPYVVFLAGAGAVVLLLARLELGPVSWHDGSEQMDAKTLISV